MTNAQRQTLILAAKQGDADALAKLDKVTADAIVARASGVTRYDEVIGLGVHHPEESVERCATCGAEAELTHVSPYGELICRDCAEAPEWTDDGLPAPVRKHDATAIPSWVHDAVPEVW